MDDILKRLLCKECSYRLPDELLDEFLSKAVEVKLRRGEVLVPYDKMDDNVYVVKNGIIRYCYFDCNREKTFSFATPGNVLINYHCYYMHQPSFFQLETCCTSVVMKISKRGLVQFIDRSHEFAKGIMTLSLEQLYANDKKLSLINGRANERFMALIQNRPEIMSRVPLNIIASYLGITPQYLSQLRKQFSEEIAE
jgi:CRP-like cAMP-binding protein